MESEGSGEEMFTLFGSHVDTALGETLPKAVWCCDSWCDWGSVLRFFFAVQNTYMLKASSFDPKLTHPWNCAARGRMLR